MPNTLSNGKNTKKKNPHAVWMGRRGGLASSAGRMKKLTPEQRREIARNAARKRWARYKKRKTQKLEAASISP